LPRDPRLSYGATMSDAYLELIDWRRRIAELYAAWRSEAAYHPEAATTAFRAAREALFMSHPQSPLPAARRASGPPPAWWPYDPAWRMRATFEAAAVPGPHDDGNSPGDGGHDGGNIGQGAAGQASAGPPSPILAVPSSGPSPFTVRRIGRVDLSGPLAGHSLAALWIEGYGNGLFLPFRDATSGGQTYGAGRYLLDTVKGSDHGADPASGTLTLDFNMAYHPSCAYDSRWVCPLAPLENRLPVAITVGERLA